jgi:secreted trypsin-like serine protease
MRLRTLALLIGGAVTALLGTTGPAIAAEPAQSQPAIIGGSNASSGPWAARLFVNGQQNCTATIIAPQYILTAKHCVSGSGTYTFRIGSLDQQSGGTMATGSTITRHRVTPTWRSSG